MEALEPYRANKIQLPASNPTHNIHNNNNKKHENRQKNTILLDHFDNIPHSNNKNKKNARILCPFHYTPRIFVLKQLYP